MTTGIEIYQVYEDMECLCVEISDMLKAIVQCFKTEGFQNFGALRWETSNALNWPTYWLPYFSQVLFTKGNSKRAVGVNVLLKDPNLGNKIPFLTCGLLESEKEIPWGSNELFGAGWKSNEGYILNHGKPISITEKDGVKVYSYFLRLEIIESLNEINQLIVSPLIELYKNSDLPSHKVINIIEKHSLQLDQIINPGVS